MLGINSNLGDYAHGEDFQNIVIFFSLNYSLKKIKNFNHFFSLKQVDQLFQETESKAVPPASKETIDKLQKQVLTRLGLYFN